MGEILGVSARILSDLLQVLLLEVEAGVLISLLGSATSCASSSAHVLSILLLFDLTKELDDLLNRHADTVVAFAIVATIVIETLLRVGVRFE